MKKHAISKLGKVFFKKKSLSYFFKRYGIFFSQTVMPLYMLRSSIPCTFIRKLIKTQLKCILLMESQEYDSLGKVGISFQIKICMAALQDVFAVGANLNIVQSPSQVAPQSSLT